MYDDNDDEDDDENDNLEGTISCSMEIEPAVVNDDCVITNGLVIIKMSRMIWPMITILINIIITSH